MLLQRKEQHGREGQGGGGGGEGAREELISSSMEALTFFSRSTTRSHPSASQRSNANLADIHWEVIVTNTG